MSDKQKTVLALGYFDGVHKGHLSVFKTAENLAKKHNCKWTVVSFKGNLRSVFGKGDETVVFSESEREKIFRDLMADDVCLLPIEKTFLAKSKSEFLEYLSFNFNICGYVCGEDYRFGKNGEGNVGFLQNFAQDNNQILKVVKTMRTNGKKISATLIKKLLIKGKIKRANRFLAVPYFIRGQVISGRGQGKLLGFPTANIKIDEKKTRLKNGVYYGKIVIDDSVYKAMINYGTCPTFNQTEFSIEVFVLNFNDNLYGKTVSVEFHKYLRKIKKFKDEQALVKQIKKDESKIWREKL